MKTHLTSLCILLFTATTIAQNGINYKGILKDNNGIVTANQAFLLRFKILKTSAAGTLVYQEVHNPSTDNNGIFMVNIGEGFQESGVFEDIDWESDTHYLNVIVQTNTGIEDMGTTELKWVPYAHYSNKSDSSTRSSISEQITMFETGTNNPDKMVIQHSPAFPDWGLQYSDAVEEFNFVADGIPTVNVDLSSGSLSASGSIMADSNITTNGRIGIGVNTPSRPLTIVHDNSTNNTISVFAGLKSSGFDVLELQVDEGTSATAQFIEMQRGTTPVASVNTDGSAKFKSVEFEDNTVQTTAATGPLAKAYLDVVSGTSTTVNISGSSTLSASFNIAGGYIFLSLTGVSFDLSTHMVHVTAIRDYSSSTTWDRTATVQVIDGNLRIYVWDASLNSLAPSDCFIIIYEL